MGVNGWIIWFERLAAGERRPRVQLLSYIAMLAVLAILLKVLAA